MDSTFIYKQGSLNRGHFIIALIFTGGREPACHPAGWPRLGSMWVSKVLSGGGRINTIGLETGKETQETLCAQHGKTELLGIQHIQGPLTGVSLLELDQRSLYQGKGYPTGSNRILRGFDSGTRNSLSSSIQAPSLCFPHPVLVFPLEFGGHLQTLSCQAHCDTEAARWIDLGRS